MAGSNKGGSRENVGAIARELNRDNKSTSPVVEALNLQVANAFVLYANYKHYHWQTFGPLFRDLHMLFDEQAAAVIGSVDELAERVRMIGQNPPVHLTEMQDLASVSPAAPHASMHDMIEEADRNALIVIKEMRDAVKVAESHNDPGTVDLFSKLVQVHEKHEWFLREILRRGDGIVD